MTDAAKALTRIAMEEDGSHPGPSWFHSPLTPRDELLPDQVLPRHRSGTADSHISYVGADIQQMPDGDARQLILAVYEWNHRDPQTGNWNQEGDFNRWSDATGSACHG